MSWGMGSSDTGNILSMNETYDANRHLLQAALCEVDWSTYRGSDLSQMPLSLDKVRQPSRSGDRGKLMCRKTGNDLKESKPREFP